MKYFPLLFFVSFIACEQSPTVNYEGDLEIGKAKDGFLAKETAESYHLSLDSNSFVYGFVDQLSVDVVVKLYDEDEKVLGNFDGPKRGPEQFSFEISKTGEYKLEISPFKEETGEYQAEHISEPSPDSLLGELLPKSVHVQLHSCLLETSTSEHAARMAAMDNATNACNDLIESLTLLYNKARQATITAELMDIVGGAEALKG